MKLNGKQYDKFILNGKTYEKFYLNNKIYQSLDPGLILDLPLQNNFTDYSASGISMVAGGTSNQPTFALSGRKAGEYCAIFNGSQSIKTTTNLPINSDKVTIKFWMKTTQTTAGAVMELSPIWSTAGTNAFAVFVNGATVNKLYMAEQTTNTVRNIRDSSSDINDNSWKRIAIVFDRAKGTPDKISIYINGSLAGITSTTTGSTTGNFVNNILFIGQRGGSTMGYNGSLMHLEILNYPIMASEALADYNSFL